MAENQGSKAMMAGLVGLGLGLGAGILMAPKSGDDTRKDMRSKLDDAKDQAGRVAGKAKKKWREFKEEVRRENEARVPDELESENRV